MDKPIRVATTRVPPIVPPEAGVTLTWPNRSWCVAAPMRETPVELHTLEVSRRNDGEHLHRLVHGDGLDVVTALRAEGLAGSVDMVYIDPPFASEGDYLAAARLDGPATGRTLRSAAYKDRWSSGRGGLGAYLDMLAPRLEALTTLLSPRGTIWVHVDWRAAYLVRTLLDEILGRGAFKNEIVWRRAPNLGRQATSDQFGRTLDTIVVYGREEAKLRPPTRLEPVKAGIKWDDENRPFTSAPRGDYTDASIERLAAEGRVYRSASGGIYIKYFLVKNAEGVLCRERRVDTFWDDIAPLRHCAPSERTGYPTQKPRALLERIVSCASEPGGIVVDTFAGSGTTGAAAHVLGRRAILADTSPVAIGMARARLLREAASLQIERTAGMASLEATPVTVHVENGRLRLVEPTEPLGWAVGTEERGVFYSTWHSERVPGRRAIPATLEAPVPWHPGVCVRVFLDDGRVGRWQAR